VPADDHERLRQEAADLLGQTDGAVPLGGEVALEAHDGGGEATADLQALLFAFQPQVDDLADMAVRLQAPGHTDQAERLDEGQHLEAEDASDRRFEEGDVHGTS
jgi:hypothetical protein